MKIVRRQFLHVAGAAITMFAISASSWGAEQNIVGSWKLVSLFTEELGNGEDDQPTRRAPQRLSCLYARGPHGGPDGA